MRWFTGAAFALAAPVRAGCIAPSAQQIAQNDYKQMIAASLNYYESDKMRGQYEISDSWTAVTGEVMVCLAAHIPDGKGGYYPAADYSMYAMKGGKITYVMREAVDCSGNATFAALPPISH